MTYIEIEERIKNHYSELTIPKKFYFGDLVCHINNAYYVTYEVLSVRKDHLIVRSGRNGRIHKYIKNNMRLWKRYLPEDLRKKLQKDYWKGNYVK